MLSYVCGKGHMLKYDKALLKKSTPVDRLKNHTYSQSELLLPWLQLYLVHHSGSAFSRHLVGAVYSIFKHEGNHNIHGLKT